MDGTTGFNAGPAQVFVDPDISAGSSHICYLNNIGAVQCWGSNSSGQLGNGESGNVPTSPVDVVGLQEGVASIAAGGSHSCAVTAAGGVKCWGNNEFGQLGNNATTSSSVVGGQNVIRIWRRLTH